MSTIFDKIERQRAFFASGATLDWRYRMNKLRMLRSAVKSELHAVAEALHSDLNKSLFESFSTELMIVLGEMNQQLKWCRRFRKPRRVPSSLLSLTGSSWVQYQPHGLTLIVSPWNYPFHLALMPLVGAVAAGNVVTLKLSPDAPATNQIIRKIVSAVFTEQEVLVLEGHRDVNALLFEQKWDHIFLTGSPELGKIAMASAAKYLTPVTLELGGKSPCIVDAGANLAIAAKRVAFGKCINAGQTCIAPDYLLVHNSVKQRFVEELKRQLQQFYPEGQLSADYYPHIVNDKSMKRLVGYVEELKSSGARILVGGEYDIQRRCMAFTVVENVPHDHELLQREVFGPIFPLLTFDRLDEVAAYINKGEKPLALYYFGDKKNARKVLRATTSGGACVNDTLMHIVNHNLPFGGAQNSGIGNYHGKYSYITFSHQRAVFRSSLCCDMWFRYPSYFVQFGNLLKKVFPQRKDH